MDDSPEPSATQCFDAWISSRPDATGDDLAELCAERPGIAEALRAEWRKYERARFFLAELAAAGQRELVEAVYRLAREPSSWSIGQEIGRGGVCIVEEIREQRLGRRLARKVLPIDLRSRELTRHDLRRLARFVVEARVAGRLQHPAIPQVHDFGVDDAGRPFLVLPLVDGEALAEKACRLPEAGPSWSTTRAVQALVAVCGAVSHAHERGILHRDIKPENVMIGRLGEVFLVDWGLAKSLATDEEPAAKDETLDQLLDEGRTLDGDILGTPAYMSPEQAGGGRIGPASDQYQIGATLYALLSGTRPFEDTQATSSARDVVDAVVAGPPTPLVELAPGAPVELIAIAERAMARRPEDRYPSVDHLAADLRAFLEVRVVSAYDTGAFATLRKWTQRNRGVAAAIAGTICVVLLGLTVFLLVERSLRNQLRATNDELSSANSEKSERLLALQRELYVNDLAAVQRGLYEGQRPSELAALLERAPAEFRGIEWRWLHRQLDTSAEHYPMSGGVFALSPNEAWLVTARGRDVKLWQARPARLLAERRLPFEANACAFAPDGKEIAVAPVVGKGAFLTLPSLATIREFELGGDTRVLCYRRDGRCLFLSGYVPALRVIDTATGGIIKTLEGHSASVGAIACDLLGRWIATGDVRGEVRIWHPRSLEARYVFRAKGQVAALSFAVDGTLRAGTAWGQVATFDTAAGKPGESVLLAGNQLRVQALEPTGSWHVYGQGAALHLTQLTMSRHIGTGNGHDGTVHTIRFAPQSMGVFSSAEDGVRFWHWRDRQMRRHVEARRVVSDLEITHDGRLAVFTALGTGLGVWNVARGRAPKWHRLPATRHNKVALSADEASAAVGGVGCPLTIVRLAGGEQRRLAFDGHAAGVGWSKAGLFAVSAGGKRIARFDHDAQLREPWPTPFETACLAVRGATVAVGGARGDVAVIADGRVAWRASCGAGVRALGFSANGSELACALESGRVAILSSRDGRTLRELVGHGRPVTRIRGTATRWVTASLDGTLRIWDAETGRQLLREVPDDWWLGGAAISGDETIVVTGGEGGILHAWSLRP